MQAFTWWLLRRPSTRKQREIENRLVCGLIEARESAASVGRLELRYRVFPALALAQIKPAQLIVQNAGEENVNFGWPRGRFSRHRQRSLFFLPLQADSSFLRGPATAMLAS